MLEWIELAQSLEVAIVCVPLRGFAVSKHVAWIACVQQSLAMYFVKRTVTSVDDTSAAGVSCVRRMAT